MREAAVAIRLALHGCANRPFYTIVAMRKSKARNGRTFEQLGTYDPMPNQHEEKLVAINYSRLNVWTERGAEISKPVAKLLGLSGYFPIHPMTYVEAKRNRKAAAKRLVEDDATDKEEALGQS